MQHDLVALCPLAHIHMSERLVTFCGCTEWQGPAFLSLIFAHGPCLSCRTRTTNISFVISVHLSGSMVTTIMIERDQVPETYDKGIGLRLAPLIMYSLLSLDRGKVLLHGDLLAVTIKHTFVASKWHRLPYTVILTVRHHP